MTLEAGWPVASCFELAHQGAAADREHHRRRTFELLERACADGDLAKCEWLARDLPRPTFATVPVRQLTLLRTACEGGRASACATWSQALELGWYGPPNRAEAVAVLVEQCGAERLSCDRLAELAERIEGGRPAPADPIEAERLYRIACERGVSTACRRWKVLAAEPATR